MLVHIIVVNTKKQTKFDVIACQNAIHYFLKDNITWDNFKSNINQTLRSGGFLILTHLDARIIISELENNKSLISEYTDENGNKEKLYEIIKKYDNIDLSLPIGVGHPIDLYAGWMFEDGNYVTEYLVDIEFLKQDLLKSCDLESIETDTFKNQFDIHSAFFKDGVYNYEPNLETREFLNKVSKYYDVTEINKKCYTFTKLHRFSVFRKKESGQIGGTDIYNIDKYYVPNMGNYDMDYSLQNSIHEIFRSHKVIPDSLLTQDLFVDMNLKLLHDYELNDIILPKLLSEIKIEHELDNNKIKKIVDGINIYTFERDTGNKYKVNIIKANDTGNTRNTRNTRNTSNTRNTRNTRDTRNTSNTRDTRNTRDTLKVLTMIKEGQLYKPLYISVDGEKQAMFKHDDKLLEQLLEK